MTSVERTVNSVNRLNALYLAQRKEKEEKLASMKLNLAKVLVVVSIVGILAAIL